jgi:hypothetical protein
MKFCVDYLSCRVCIVFLAGLERLHESARADLASAVDTFNPSCLAQKSLDDAYSKGLGSQHIR